MVNSLFNGWRFEDAWLAHQSDGEPLTPSRARRRPPSNRPRLGAGIHPGQIEHRIGPTRRFDIGIVAATSGLQRAFDHFGAIPKNIRWSVSGRSPDGRTVAMVLWQHRLDYTAKPISYSHFGWHQLLNHNDEPSTKERVENLIWARDHCDGLFRVIIAVPVDPNDIERGIADAFPHDRLIMKLVQLDEQTGEFSAVNVGT